MSHANRDRIQRWVSLPEVPDKIWADIGGFGDLATWHPGVDSVEVFEIEGDVHRHLTMIDGSLLLERLIETGSHYYTYELVDGPLPLANHRATLSCVAEDDGCHVFWSAIFEPTDPAADDIVAGFYEQGLGALRERYGA
jgi:hypothetical protein